MDSLQRWMGTLSGGAWLVICFASAAGVGLLLWAGLWFGLSSQCGGGYGSCTVFRRAIAPSLAITSVIGAAGLGLLAVCALLRALYLALRCRTRRSTVALSGMILLLVGIAIVIARTSADPPELFAYGLLLVAVSLTTTRGLSRSE